MILIVVRHLIRPECADDFPRMMGAVTAATRAEPGSVSFEWSRSTDDPAAYFLIEVFRDAAAGEAHVSSGHFKAAITQLPDLLAAPPEIINADVAGDGWSPMAELQPSPGRG